MRNHAKHFVSHTKKEGLVPLGLQNFLMVHFNIRPDFLQLHSRSQTWKAPTPNLLLAAQQIVQAERADFIKVTGVEQVTDSLVVSQT